MLRRCTRLVKPTARLLPHREITATSIRLSFDLKDVFPANVLKCFFFVDKSWVAHICKLNLPVDCKDLSLFIIHSKRLFRVGEIVHYKLYIR